MSGQTQRPSSYGPGPDYDKRQKRERIRTVLIGLTIGCALSAMLLFARSAMKPAATPGPAAPAATTSSPATGPSPAPAQPVSPATPPTR